MIGETLGAYKVISRLGAGGMGEVYLAQHTRIDRRAAIKVLLPELSSNQEVVDRFFSEARATSSIHHRGIVEVLDCDVHPSGRAYIVMELLEGDSLAGRLARDKTFGRDLNRVLAVTGAIADALGAAHAKGIVHRDLKPDNVFLANDPGAPFGFMVKILDFGIAKLMSGDPDGKVSARTRTGSLMGTPAYMSPEQCRGASRVDHRTDIYSLGCIVYEMLAGRLPFVYEGFGEIISAHMTEPPPAFAAIGADAPPVVEQWTRRLLAKSPAERPATMSDVVASLREMQAGAGLKLTTWPSGMAPSGPAAAMAKTTLSEHAAESVPNPVPRNRLLPIGVGALVVVGAVAGVLKLRSPGAAPVPPPVAAAAPPVAPAAPAPISIAVSDAPDGLTVLVDGKPATLPVHLPAGSDVHELVFRAPGLKERTIRLDGSTSRMLTLAMQPLPAPPTAAAAVAAPPAEHKHHAAHAPRAPSGELSDDARKL
jgi:tRNA A-37 threonylcarbamoyl transferase component Bud32